MDVFLHSGTMQAVGPYPGLRPFRHDEVEIFFGREEQTDHLLEKLRRSHFIAVVGPSGCGKSSLVRAGMIAALEAGFLADAGAGWRIADMRPGDQPIARLAEALLAPSALGPERGADPSEVAVVQTMLRRGPLGLIEILRETRLPKKENLLVLVDQFEEIFRFREQGSADDADAFVALLLTSAAQREVPVYVVITMRSDFLGECALFLGLPEAINESQYLTPRLTREQIRAAIAGPARVFGGEVEPALVNHLLNEIGPDPDQLPLLQHALMRMWRRVSEHRQNNASGDAPGGTPPSVIMTMADYDAVGALSKALSEHADQVYKSLTARQQGIVRIMMCRLTERGVGKRDIRHPARLDDIADVAGVPAQEVIEVAEEFRQQERSFLTPPPPVPITSKTVLDIGHESLIRQWHKLYDWVEEEAASAAMYRRLLQTAHLWPKRAALWSGPDLVEASKWRDERAPSQAWASRYGSREDFDLAMKFLKNSEEKANADKETRLAEEQREQQARAQAQRYRRIRWGSVGLGVLVIAMGSMAWWAFEQKQVADTLRDNADAQKKQAEASAKLANEAKGEAEIQRKNAEDQRGVAKKAAEEALVQKGVALDQKAEADGQRMRAETLSKMARSRETAIIAAQQTQADPELGLLLALEAERMARTPQADGALQQAALASKLRLRHETSGQPLVMPITHDGRFALVRSSSPTDRTVEIRSIKPDEKPVVIDAHGPGVAMLSPDGKYVVVHDRAGSLRIWQTATGQVVPGSFTLEEAATQGFFSPNGDVLAVMTRGGKLRLWETESWRSLPPIQDLKANPRPVFSPNSKYLVAARLDGRWQVWETSTGKQAAVIGDANINASSATFSPDGMNIVTTHPTHVAALWRVASGDRVRDIGDQDHPVDRVNFSPDGKQLLTTAADNLARVWSVEDPKAVNVLTHSEKNKDNSKIRINRADFSPDGEAILTLADGVVRIWRRPFEKEQVLEGQEGHIGPVRSGGFSKDGHWIVSTGSDGTAKLWDASMLRVVGSFSGGSVTNAWLSDDSRWLLTSSRDGVVRIWDTIEVGSETSLSSLPEAPETRLRAPNADYSPPISSNGKYLLGLGVDGYSRVWDISTGALKAKLGDGAHKTERAFFSPNGERVITVGNDRWARVWDAENGKVVREIFERELIAGNFSGNTHVWTWEASEKEQHFKLWSLQGGNSSSSKIELPESVIELPERVRCASVSPDAHWLATCPDPSEKEKGAENVVQISDFLSTKKSERPGHTGPIKDVFFSRDGKFAASASYDKTARIWEVGTWRAVSKLTDHPATVRAALFSPDDKYVATVAEDNTVRVFALETGDQVSISELRGHSATVRALAFSLDGRWLVTGSDDHTARVWDTTTGRAVAAFYGHTGGVIAVAFGKEVNTIITAGEDGMIRTYRCAACVPTSELMASSQKRLNAVARTLTNSERQRFLQ